MAARALLPVLVVDDSDDDLHLIRRLLAKAGVKNPIVTFNDAEAAMIFLKAGSSSADGLKPCLVFTDLKMSGMDGFELVAWIRRQKAYAKLPVIMLSNGAVEKDIKRAKALGVTKYLVKLPPAEDMAKFIAEVCD